MWGLLRAREGEKVRLDARDRNGHVPRWRVTEKCPPQQDQDDELDGQDYRKVAAKGA